MSRYQLIATTVSAITLASCTSMAPVDSTDVQRISAPNAYQGYSDIVYDGHERSSFYVEVRDGTKLAVDLFRPTQDGALTREKLPVVWMHTPYNRRDFRGRPAAEYYPGYALELVKYGYNVALVDFRGLYASFGENTGFNRGEWLEPAKWDAYDITEWFAAQPWSNGKIGMWGCSATGGSQMQALTTKPPSLKAVIPMSAELDVYPFAALGGVVYERNIAPPNTPEAVDMVALRDKAAVAVDGPDGERLLEAAKAQHKSNKDTVGKVPFRDSLSPVTGSRWWDVSSPHTYLDALKSADTGVMSVVNWDEAGAGHGPFFTFNNLNPDKTKLLIGPSTHCDWTTVKNETGFNLVTEELRFYDYWLKDIENNVMDEPAVTYFTYNATEDKAWRQSETWPLTTEQRTPFYLSADMTLGRAAPGPGRVAGKVETKGNSDTVTVRPPANGVIFDTEILETDFQVTGHPVVNLWVESQTEDTDVNAFLLDVAPDGEVRTYHMFGRLRASRRALAEPPYNHLGLPWHSHLQSVAQPMPVGSPVQLTFDMLPMSYIFKAGHKVRFQLNFTPPPGSEPGAQVTIMTGGDTASNVVLPVIPVEN